MTSPNRTHGSLQIFRTAFTITIFAILVATLPAHAQTETVLHSFCSLANCADGDNPDGGLIVDAAGNLYGTTMYGGSNPNGGVVFKLTPSGEESIIYSFHNGFPGDGYAERSLLTMDAEGNFYGTSSMGGANSIHVPRGDGTAFKVSPDGTETILHNFGAFKTDGVEPVGGMVLDAKGNLYGTTYIGGINNANDYGSTAPGTIFRLTPEGEETILHDFANDSTDGGNPWGPLIMDRNGNVYGTTQSGGASFLTAGGTVFEITAAGDYRIIHSFAGPPSDGDYPSQGLTLDSQGNLYGATYGGGSGGGFGQGTVFKLTPGSNGTWKETLLYNFSDTTGACQNPSSNVVFDTSGNLYGTTSSGGTLGLGCAYELSPAGKFTVLHSFGAGTDGALPTGNVAFFQGSLYGTTYSGGIVYDYAGQGTVFKITP